MPQRKLAKSSSRNVSRKKPSLATARKVDDGNVVKTKSWFERHANVALYVPNVIGYLRIIFAAYALNCAFTSVRTCIFAYLLSFTCDELDGRFARKFNQCSEFGRVLDMVTDRLATCALLTVLAMEYREWYRACVALAALDVAAHWFHVYVSVFIGSDGHKDLAPNSNWLLKTYYTNRIFMGVCCTSVEVLYLCAHARRAAPNFAPTFFSFFLRAAVPGFMIKQIANLTQLRDACKTLMKIDVVEM